MEERELGKEAKLARRSHVCARELLLPEKPSQN